MGRGLGFFRVSGEIIQPLAQRFVALARSIAESWCVHADVTSAVFTAHYRESGSALVALEKTASSVFDLLQTTLGSGERELRLVQSQEAFAHPRMQFRARQVR